MGPRLVINRHNSRTPSLVEFPPYGLDTVNQCIWRRLGNAGEERIMLKPKTFAILRYLVEHAGRLVTHDELLDAVWPDTHIQPEVLKRHIFEIRTVLEDDPKNPVYIETLSRRGYQFIGPVCRTALVSPGATEILAANKLVGRDRALGELRASLQKASAGQRQIIFITGEIGIGKTSLVDEFRQQAATEVPLRVARGQCVEGYGGKEPYYPVLEALGNLCRGSERDYMFEILATQAPGWLVQVPALVNRQRATMIQEVEGTIQQSKLREIVEALETIASEKPLVVVLEDLHWADPCTVDLISTLARSRRSAKLMVICTYRQEEMANYPLKSVKQDLLVHQLCHEVVLEPLRERQVEEYLAALSFNRGVPEGLAALVYRQSEGNPLFMVAALDHMRQRGYLSDEEGVWKLNLPTRHIDMEVPESLLQMIELQIERLSEEERSALEAASVAGDVFSAEVSAVAADMQLDHFETLCENLSRRHCIVRAGSSEELAKLTNSQCYQFVHRLYRYVLYCRQPVGRRARQHLRIGERLEVLYAQRLNEAAFELAHHFEKGRDPLRAAKYRQLVKAPVESGSDEPQSAVPLTAGPKQAAKRFSKDLFG
jgi:predicted ATPase